MKFLWHILSVHTHLLCCSTSCPRAFVSRRVLNLSSVQIKESLSCLIRSIWIHLQREFFGVLRKKDSWGYLCSVWSLTSSSFQAVHCPMVAPLCPENYLCCWSCLSSCSWVPWAAGEHHVNEVNAPWRFFTCHWALQTCYSSYSSSPVFLVLLPALLNHSSGASAAFLDKEESLTPDITSFCCCFSCRFQVFR